VTNLHVLRGAKKASVTLANGDIYDDIAVVDVDARKDLLLIKVKAAGLDTARLGDSSHVSVGDKVVLIGSPRGLQTTVTDGLISAIRDSGEGYRILQTNAAASPGSSGGGMFNDFGELIGIVSAKLPTAENINFAVPVNYVKGLISTQVRMSLAQLAGEYPADSKDAGSANAPSQPHDSAVGKNTVQRLLDSSGLKYQPAGDDGWKVAYDGEKAETITVYVNASDDTAYVQAIVRRSFSPESIQQTIKLLQISFDTDFVKVGLTDKGTLQVLNETELRLLDGKALKRIVEAVATTADDIFGELFSNGGTETRSPLVGSRSASDARVVSLLNRHAAIDYDGNAWKGQQVEKDRYVFKHSSGLAFIKVIPETTEIPLDKLAEIALMNAQSVDPQAVEVKRGTRLVNGLRFSFLEFDATVDKMPVRYYGHYYADDAGTVQILGWCLRDFFDSYRDNIESFVSGFRVKGR
jgi:hypothetical protein